jgi:hypothetical protein
MSRIRQLQADADRYRRLAGGAVPWPTVRRLAELAEECEREAAMLADAGRPSRPDAMPAA